MQTKNLNNCWKQINHFPREEGRGGGLPLHGIFFENPSLIATAKISCKSTRFEAYAYDILSVFLVKIVFSHLWGVI